MMKHSILLAALVFLAWCSIYNNPAAPSEPVIDDIIVVETGMIVEPDPTPAPAISMSGTLSDLVTLNSVSEWDIISSPLLLTGTAPGNWFFEGSAPVTVVNRDWLIIGEWYITALQDWMTTDIIAFSGSINFIRDPLTPYPSGNLILQRDNASWEPANDAWLDIPVLFQ